MSARWVSNHAAGSGVTITNRTNSSNQFGGATVAASDPISCVPETLNKVDEAMRLTLVTLSLIVLVGCGSNVSDGPSNAFTLSSEVTESPEDIESLAADLGGVYVGHHLIFADNTITDAGLERIEGMTDFDTLSLDSTKITDAGLEHLKGLTNLESLNACTSTGVSVRLTLTVCNRSLILLSHEHFTAFMHPAGPLVHLKRPFMHRIGPLAAASLEA